MIYSTPITTKQEITPELFNQLSDNGVNSTDNIHPMYDILYASYQWAKISVYLDGGGAQVTQIETNKIQVAGGFVSGVAYCEDFIPIPAYMVDAKLRLRFTVTREVINEGSAYYLWVGTVGSTIYSTTAEIAEGSVDVVTPEFTITEACSLVLRLQGRSTLLEITKVILEATT
jgi:hypothetical protein